MLALGPNLGFVESGNAPSNKLRSRRLALNSWREIATKEAHQSRPSAARVLLSIESKGRLPILARIFGVGHIVAFPRSVILEVDT